MELTPKQRKQLLNTYYGLTVKTHAAHLDLKDLKGIRIVSRDNTLCMYDYAKEILQDEKRL